MSAVYAVQTRDDDTTGQYGSYTCLIRADSHKAAALALVQHEVDETREYWLEAGEPCLGMEDDITVIEVPSHGSPQGFVDGTVIEFSLQNLIKEIQQ